MRNVDLSRLVPGPDVWELDAPIARVCSEEVPIPYARHLETAAIPQVPRIVGAAKIMLARA